MKKYLSLFFSVGFLLFVGGTIWAQWSPPGSAPPGGNVAAPINVSGDAQAKVGDLILFDPNVGINAVLQTEALDVLDTAKFAGLFDMQGNPITNLAAPLASGDGANKAYVDAAAGAGAGVLDVYKNDGTTHLGKYLGFHPGYGVGGANFCEGWLVALDTGGIKLMQPVDCSPYSEYRIYWTGSTSCSGFGTRTNAPSAGLFINDGDVYIADASSYSNTIKSYREPNGTCVTFSSTMTLRAMAGSPQGSPTNPVGICGSGGYCIVK